MAKSFFFSLNYKSFPIQTGFEQLSISIHWRWPLRKGMFFNPNWGLWVKFFTNFWCFVHNFGYRYARKSFKSSKDADFGLVSKKILSHNNGPMGCGSGPGKCSQKHSHLWCSPRKRKMFYFLFRL